ncbi:MAG: aryl-alcohol dehydrogenase-like predicted oxidoreductase/enamine deaminase RidA [Cyclobacteriaceae bacterium]|jgi:aryl-alcohol dehydrogenase-like predicted oxidoreductase/enamine deaminase RidA (YjgF/YER057c/UK114 family)
MDKSIKLTENLHISRVLTGLWQIADMERDGQTLDPMEAASAMKPYIESGLTTFDMADHYGSAETISGTFFKHFKEGKQAQFLTKWVPKPGKVSPETVRKAVTDALSKLKKEKIDLLQYHAWSYVDPAWLDTLYELQKLKEEGLIEALGVTNFDASHLRVAAASGIELVTNQICYSLLDQRAAGDMHEVCKMYGIKILAFGTLGGGFLSNRWLDKDEPKELDTWSQMKYKRFIDVTGGWSSYQELLRGINEVAQKHDSSITTVATRFILDQEAVGGVIVGARLGKSSHIDDTLKIYELKLSQEEHSQIKSLLAKLEPVPGGCGDEYRKPPFLTASGDLSHHIEQIPPPFESIDMVGGGKQIMSGTVWEDMAGYCRAVRKGNRISVSGTTATHGERMIGGSDPAAQATFVLDKIQGAIESLGGSLEDVIRTRIFVNDINDWEPVARAHGERFATIKPANTLVEAKLVGDGYLVEIEAEAEIMS